MENIYLDFISDEDLLWCISELYSGYKKAFRERNLNKFMENRIDPIKFVFDAKIMGVSIKEYMENEIIRQTDRSISNHIGIFHENLLGKINGYERLEVGNTIDIISEDGKLIAEVKNKHNTVKKSNQNRVFDDLKSFLDDPNHAAETAYYVRINDNLSQNVKWGFTRNKGKDIYEHDDIYIISGDKFYELLTGDPNAFAKLCSILPRALNDYINTLSKEEVIKLSDSTIVQEIENYYQSENEEEIINDIEFSRRLFEINFFEKSKYPSFENFEFSDE